MADLLSAAKRYSVPVRQIGQGDVLGIGGVRIEVLWPVVSNEPVGSDNNSSLVLRLSFGGRNFLFTGDVEKEAEARIVGLPLEADVIKVPHHGSRTSSTEEFVSAVSPRLAVIPVGRRSMFGHPHPEVVERWRKTGAEVTTTGWKGTITVKTDGNTLVFETFQP